MKTRYFLTNIISKDKLEIDLARFESLKKYRSQLLEALYLEEKYDIFLSNYLVIEKELLVKAIERYFYRNEMYKDFHEYRLNMNKLFINFLSSVRMYQDQAPGHVRNCLTHDQNAIKNSKNLFSLEFDSSIEYQFMEELRNHSQHGGHAVHSITYRRRNIESDDLERNELSILVLALKSILMENSNFRKKRLEKTDEKIDLIMFSRKYIQCLNNCHLQMREMISQVIGKARSEIESIQSDFKKGSTKTLDNTYLIRTDEEEKEIIERIPLLLDHDDERIALINKNQRLNNVSMVCFASTSYSGI